MWASRVGRSFSFKALAVFKWLLALIVLSHWMACCWGLGASFGPMNSWMGAYGYCRYPTQELEEEETQATTLADESPPLPPGLGELIRIGDAECVNEGRLYAAALYYSVMTLTAVGKGYDELPAGPFGKEPTVVTSVGEQVFATLLTLFSGLLWAWIIASFASILTTADPSETLYRNHLDTLNT